MRALKKIIIFVIVAAVIAAAAYFGYGYYQKWKGEKEPAGEVSANYADGVLTVEGSGRMPNYSSAGSDREWDSYKDELTNVVIGSGITGIGKNAFMNMTAMTEARIGSDVEIIDVNAFNGCSSLESVNIPASVKTIGENAFWGCKNLKDISYEGSKEDWDQVSIGENNIVLTDANIRFAGGEEVSDSFSAAGSAVEETEEVNIETTSMYRVSNSETEELYYTTIDSERDALVASGWNYDGIMWKQPKSSNTPIYRLQNPATGAHYYTIDWQQRTDCVAAGWSVDGIIGYSDDRQSIPVYRVQNPNAVIATHCYTVSEEEVNTLVAAGWINEGVAWYACS